MSFWNYDEYSIIGDLNSSNQADRNFEIWVDYAYNHHYVPNKSSDNNTDENVYYFFVLNYNNLDKIYT